MKSYKRVAEDNQQLQQFVDEASAAIEALEAKPSGTKLYKHTFTFGAAPIAAYKKIETVDLATGTSTFTTESFTPSTRPSRTVTYISQSSSNIGLIGRSGDTLRICSGANMPDGFGEEVVCQRVAFTPPTSETYIVDWKQREYKSASNTYIITHRLYFFDVNPTETIAEL